jgi:hypothetical protein
MHPSACKATAPSSSLPLLMIPLPPALPTNHNGSVPRRRKTFCGSSALISASSTTVSSSRRRWCCRDSCSATEEEEGWSACYGWPRIGDASESFQLCWLMDKAREEGRDRVSIVQTWSLFSTGSLREEPLRQPDSSLTPYHPYPSPLLGRLPQSQHQGSRYPFDCQRYGFSARRPLSEKVDR